MEEQRWRGQQIKVTVTVMSHAAECSVLNCQPLYHLSLCFGSKRLQMNILLLLNLNLLAGPHVSDCVYLYF